jgi:peroxiredoxin
MVPPCRRGIPDLVSLQDEFKGDVVVIGISTDQNTRGDVPELIQQLHINYPIAFSTPEVVESFGGIDLIPTTFIIDRNGLIADKQVGLVPRSVISGKIQSLK